MSEMYEIDLSDFPQSISNPVFNSLSETLSDSQEHFITVNKFSQLIIINGEHKKTYGKLKTRVKKLLDDTLDQLYKNNEITSEEYKQYKSTQIQFREAR